MRPVKEGLHQLAVAAIAARKVLVRPASRKARLQQLCWCVAVAEVACLAFCRPVGDGEHIAGQSAQVGYLRRKFSAAGHDRPVVPDPSREVQGCDCTKDVAARSYSEAILDRKELSPEDHWQLAQTWLQQGKSSEALNEAVHATKIFPDRYGKPG